MKTSDMIDHGMGTGAPSPKAAELLTAVSAYLDLFPEERDEVQPLLRHIDEFGDFILDRANPEGHVTTSAAIIDTAATKMILVHHRTLDRWLQPGGHYEGDDTLVRSAEREGIEEAGILQILRPKLTTAGVPIDIDSHSIPANPRKREGAHVHHDLAFLFTTYGGETPIAQLAEVNEARWMRLDEIPALGNARLTRLAAKARRVRWDRRIPA